MVLNECFLDDFSYMLQYSKSDCVGILVGKSGSVALKINLKRSIIGSTDVASA